MANLNLNGLRFFHRSEASLTFGHAKCKFKSISFFISSYKLITYMVYMVQRKICICITTVRLASPAVFLYTLYKTLIGISQQYDLTCNLFRNVEM